MLSRKVRLDFDSKCLGYQVQVSGFTSKPILGGDGQKNIHCVDVHVVADAELNMDSIDCCC